MDKNTYVSLDEKFHIGRIRVDEDRKTVETFTLEGWQAEMGVDKNASFYVPEKDGKKYPYSDIFINEGNETKTFKLDPKYDYIGLDGKPIVNEPSVEAKEALVVFYKGK
jgi:hypothetical protein